MKETKQINQLPDGWRVVSLNQIADIIPSNVDKKIYSNEIPVFLCNYMDVYSNDYLSNRNQYSTGSVTFAELQKFKLKSGDVIITKDSETPDDIAVPAVVVEDMQNVVCGYHLALIRPKSEVEGEYLSKAFQTYFCRRHFGNAANGATRYGLTQKVIATCPIILPPKSEQSTIATILTTIDQAIEKTEQLIAKYERIKIGLMQDLLTRGIDENGNIRSEETHEFKDSVLGRIPKEWEVNKMGNWLRVKGGNAFQSKDFTSSGIQLLRIGNLFNNQFDLHRSPVFLPENYSLKFPEFVLKPGDVIMSMTGTYGKRDYGYAILIEKGQYLLNQRLCKLIFNEDVIDKSFLLFLLRSEYYLDELFKSVTGSKQGNLRNSNILDVKVGLPDIGEQRRISEKISLLYEAIQKEGRNLEKFKKQKNALMQDLLTGKVRVDTLLNTKKNESVC